MAVEVRRIPSGKEGRFLVCTLSRDERGGRGFQMAEPCPYVGEWARCYDGTHPLLDIGCAMGLNVQAAVEEMGASGAAGGVRVLAADFEPRHLEYVDALGCPGVRTVHCKLPAETPDDEVRAHGGLSAVLLSEVLHFLTGAEIDASLAWAFGALVPGGKLFITACSPHYNMGAEKNRLLLRRQREERRRGNRWPLSPDDDFSPLRLGGDAAPSVDPTPDNTYKSAFGVDVSGEMPTSLHCLEFELVDACRAAGFQCLEAALRWRDGYPESLRLDGRETIQIVAMKPREGE